MSNFIFGESDGEIESDSSSCRKNRKVHVVLSNLGGAKYKRDVWKFLFNLFNDKYILMVPCVPRFLLAVLISTIRRKKLIGEYERLNFTAGSVENRSEGSPILKNTAIQAKSLAEMLNLGSGDEEYLVYVSMRYSYPYISTAMKAVKKRYRIGDQVILLPLYPQYSVSTSYSAIEEFYKNCSDLSIYNADSVKSFYRNKKYISCCAGLINKSLNKIRNRNIKTILLFSAHGIPEFFVDKYKDVYEKHVHETIDLIWKYLLEEIGLRVADRNLEYRTCFQSKVGSMDWLTPYIQDVIPECEGCNVVVFPVSFVSEHLETLVELDIQYAELSRAYGVVQYVRAMTPGNDKSFIEALRDEILKRVD